MQIYAFKILEPGVLDFPALKAPRSIIDLEKKELFVKKSVEEPQNFESVPKTRRVLCNGGTVLEPWTEISFSRKRIKKFKQKYGRLVGGK